MFLFILFLPVVPCMVKNLNTSHVLIYPNLFEDYVQLWEFKYISCSYLSPGDLPQTECLPDLNTSHVLIYRRTYFLEPSTLVHLNTSHVLIYRNNAAGKYLEGCIFKYISCSYLSLMGNTIPLREIDLNTSHVLIYL